MTDKEKLEKIKELADKMYSRMAYLTSDTRPIRKAMDEYHQFIVNEYHKEESISEDLEEAIGEYCSNPENFITYIDVGFKQSPIKKDDIPLIIKAIKFGAKWQKEQILDCNTTLQRTFELGKQEMKQQMMANAIDMEVKVDAGGYPYIPQIELYDYLEDIPLAKEGDKYNVILIKED